MATGPKLTPFDNYRTATTVVQHETEEVLHRHIPKDGKPPALNKSAHMQFLVKHLVQGFPSRYTSQDASQPWLLFWILQAFSCLGVVLDPGNKQKAIDKIMLWQHPAGGFGGGPGQAAHLLTTYASVCSLAIVGRSGEGGGWDEIDRKAIYNFFLSLKQKDGSFLVAHHSEVDVRGVYCLLVVATLLDIITPELVAGTPEFIASCQTYEGGFSSASFPSYDTHNPGKILGGSPRPALGEAHGGYTFCALASWIMLQPYIKLSAAKPTINLKSLTRWLVQMQGVETELGGFKGRTNKLVDGCYSWWCGGAFGLLEALGVGGLENAKAVNEEVIDEEEEILKGLKVEAGDWVDVDDELFNSKALQEYILYAGQSPSGGLRDKPPKPADAYHTLYCLSGLSSAQHHVFPSKTKHEKLAEEWSSKNERQVDLLVSAEDKDLETALRREGIAAILSWGEDPVRASSAAHIVGGKDNRLNATHPITNLTITHTEGIAKWAYGL
ncbi:terpenoid cyclases/protein prenyltransferase alpha-alpha toroid [Ephemerocybe angulata]|uniref:Protein farnesyltransferase subunit beta n=1 Tax=Ephemerocybe angulata TaxID=980116 RepID=A0A8H6M4J5_9AGAR|nr:terpenoid cyclases/protein prenyltransferase alpha-alpha toroid [Tulosesus angulatus]